MATANVTIEISVNALGLTLNAKRMLEIAIVNAVEPIVRRELKKNLIALTDARTAGEQ